MAKTVFECFSDPRTARFLSGLLDAFAIIGVNLLERRRGLQLLGRISEDFLVGETVVNAPALHIHDGDHVRGVIADEVKELFAFEELAADSMNQQILIDGVEVEEKNQIHQASHGLRQHR
jgi:hypothetical protein